MRREPPMHERTEEDRNRYLPYLVDVLLVVVALALLLGFAFGFGW